MMSMNGIIKDVCGIKLLPMTISAHPVDFVCFWHLLKTQHCCLCPIMEGITLPQQLLPAHLLVQATCDITVVVKNSCSVR